MKLSTLSALYELQVMQKNGEDIQELLKPLEEKYKYYYKGPAYYDDRVEQVDLDTVASSEGEALKNFYNQIYKRGVGVSLDKTLIKKGEQPKEVVKCPECGEPLSDGGYCTNPNCERDIDKKDLSESNKDIVNEFIEQTNKHISLVNKYAKKIGKEYKDHDNDKLNKHLKAYSYRNLDKRTDEQEDELNKATLEHIVENEHHPEHWATNFDMNAKNKPKHWNPHKKEKQTSGGTQRGLECSNMPNEALDEMCCDWCAVSEIENNSPIDWFNKNCNSDDNRWIFTEEQKEYIKDRLNELWKDNLSEAISEMTDETLKKYVKECVQFLADNGYDATMEDIDCVVSDATRTFGSMKVKKSPNGKYVLTLSSHLKGEPEEVIKNTIYHELCHYLQYKENFADKVWAFDYFDKLTWGPEATHNIIKRNSKGHGGVWKRLAGDIGRLTNQKITRTGNYDTHKNVGKAFDDKVKYVVKCTNCGNELKYTKKTDFVKNPNAKSSYGDHYRWGCGKCKARGQWEVVERK